MKKERRQARIYLYILAAAILAIGGTAAAVAYSVKKEHESIENSNPLTEEELANAIITPVLTDQQDVPDAHGLAMTEGGFFFLGKEFNPDIEFPNTAHALRYYDAESGETAYLCAKPNCLHNGSEFCTATTENYKLCSEPVYLDGYVYTIALDQHELLQNPSNCSKFPAVLLRYSVDGTEITPVAQLYFDEREYKMNAELIAHRGQLWMNCVYRQYIEAHDANMNTTEQQTYGRYEMFCYEPTAEKLTSLSTSGDWQKDYRQFETPFYDTQIKGVGDYVYILKSQGDWRDGFKGNGIFRIDCRTGLISQTIEIKQPDKVNYYEITSEKLYYTYDDTKISPHRNVENPVFHVYDLETGEDTELITLETIIQSVYPNYVYDRNKDYLHSGPKAEAFFADDTYLHVFWSYWDEDEQAEYEKREEFYYGYDALTILDTQGNIVKTVSIDDFEGVEIPREVREVEATKYPDYFGIKTEEQKNEHMSYTGDGLYIGDSTLYDNGTFYIKSSYIQYRITVEDILHGNLTPEQLYIFYAVR